jgi:5-methylcytosine-specific restriction endonuclease McrA
MELDKKTHNYILAALRRIWGWSPQKKSARKRAEIAPGVDKCEGCGLIVGRKGTQVDHINPMIPVTGFDSYQAVIERLWVEPEGLKILCLDCHKLKSVPEDRLRKQNVKGKKE